jgi:MerR family copper efflux transcriptional regulator
MRSVKPATKSRPEAEAPAGPLNIGQASRDTGVSAKMIRHYEEIGLLPPAQRSFSGYRQFSNADLHTLRFIRQARLLGFGMAQIRTLLDLWRNQARPSAEVKALAESHIGELDERIAELRRMRATLASLAHACHGDHRPVCPILQGLAEPPTAAPRN